MNFIWHDDNPETMGYVENWLDEHAVRMTGMDDGFRQEYEYWSNEDCNVVGENYWCKVVFEKDKPFVRRIYESIRYASHRTCFRPYA